MNAETTTMNVEDSTDSGLTATQVDRERALSRIVWMDTVALIAFYLFGILAGSMTLVAEAVRGTFLYIVEVYALITLRLIHRNQYAEYEFGTGKIERLVNVAIAMSLLVAAVWIGVKAVGGIGNHESPSIVFFAFALLTAEYNLVVNVLGLIGLERSNRVRPSVILQSQIGARRVKSTSSFIVFIAVLLSGVLPDPTVGNAIDVLGSLWVCAMMVLTAVEQLREAVPDLLDRSLEDPTQATVYKALAENFDEYEDITAVRSRRSGNEILVEVELAFSEDTTVGQVSDLRTRLTNEVLEAHPEARITVLPTVIGKAGVQ